MLDLDFLIGDLKLDDLKCTVGGTVRAESREWNIRVGSPGRKIEGTVTADVIANIEYKFVCAWVEGVAPPGGQPRSALSFVAGRVAPRRYVN